MKSISKRLAFILFLGVVVGASADDYVDDVYYTSDAALAEQTSAQLQPYYNKKAMQEIVFLDDTLPVGAYPDTVRAVIRR